MSDPAESLPTARVPPPIAELAERLGGRNLYPGTSADQVDGRVPQWVARPGSIEDVQAVVRFAARHRLALIPTGIGGHLDMGGRARAADIVLSLDRLDRVVDHVAGDMTVTVQAGCSLSALDEQLAETGQWLPLDPPFGAETSVGGLVATNLSGPLRASLGTIRDAILGITTVAGDGRVVHGGGRVVKNVAGYDLPRLHVGAFGTLGVIVEATFKVRPRAEREAALRFDCADAGEAMSRALALRDRAWPAWLEVVAPGVLPAARTEHDCGAALVAGFLGSDVEVEAALRQATDLLGAATELVPDANDAQDLRQRIADCARGAAVLRAAVLPTDLGALLAQLPVRDDLPWHAHATVGTVRIGVRDPEAVVERLRVLRPIAEARGGSVIVERATPAVKQSVEGGLGLWGAPPGGIEQMRGIRKALDPEGILAPGRSVV